ncbi:MAG: adenylate/guanylate cyclase domain-containing protein [Lachnospiraceae bacterium]|nr:adenylate/guanylate cyclase domain-containing protein [Lachnospiraceae bacterium]
MKKRIKIIATCTLCVVVSFLLAYFNIFGTVDKSVEDVLYHNAKAVNPKIKIIKIDDATMNKYGDIYEWNRDIYANLIEKLYVSEDLRPAVMGFDVLFSSEKLKDSDKQFADTCEKYDNIVLGFSYVFESAIVTDESGQLYNDTMAVKEKVVPIDILKNVTSQGFVNALMDSEDSKIRSAFMYFEEEDGTVTRSFNSQIYEEYMEYLGKEPDYPTDDSIMTFKYSGEPEDYENVSLCDVLDGNVPAEAFDDCIVLVGAYAAGMQDAYFVPVDNTQQMYGVEIHANVIQAIMEKNTLNRIPLWVDAIIAVIIALILVLLCDRLSVAKIVLLCGGIIISKLLIGLLLFNMGYTWNNLVVPVMALLIAVYYIGLHYYKARAARQSIEKAFSKYVAPQVVKEIAKDGTYELKLGGENRNVAVLFVDIRGFTPLSESLEPEQVVDILNNYLELTTSCIFRHGGTLDKFIGDATMAVFNSPFDTEDYVYKAILAAWDIVQGGNKIEKQFVEKYGKHVGFGVGVNCGPAVVGNIGCEFRMDYTAIGDTVNTAARLEANAPRGTVYISDAVYKQVKDRITVEDVGEIPLKGKSKGVFVYSITGINGYEG